MLNIDFKTIKRHDTPCNNNESIFKKVIYLITGYTSSSRGSSSPASTSSATLRTSRSPCERPLTLPKPTKIYRKSKKSTSHGPKYAYPDLDFLENDVGLWDAFFCSKTKYSSVLRPPLPIEEYLKNKQQPQVKAAAVPNIRSIPPLTAVSASSGQPSADASLSSARPPIHDTDSLRTLLPAAQKHLLPVVDPSRASPITQVCQSMSKLHNNERSYR